LLDLGDAQLDLSCSESKEKDKLHSCGGMVFQDMLGSNSFRILFRLELDSWKIRFTNQSRNISYSIS